MKKVYNLPPGVRCVPHPGCQVLWLWRTHHASLLQHRRRQNIQTSDTNHTASRKYGFINLFVVGRWPYVAPCRWDSAGGDATCRPGRPQDLPHRLPQTQTAHYLPGAVSGPAGADRSPGAAARRRSDPGRRLLQTAAASPPTPTYC